MASLGQSFRADRDREFLPAALEILETPPSPARRALLLTLCAFAVMALAWSFLGSIDIHAVAQGKIEPQGRVKVIEPLEAGKIHKLHVENGSHVASGDPLVELDPLDARADEAAAAQAVAAGLAEFARRKAALKAADVEDAKVVAYPAIQWDELVPSVLRNREEAALKADLTQLANALVNLDMQVAERTATRDRLKASTAVDTRLVATSQERVGMREELIRRNAGSKANLIDALQDLERAQATLTTDQGQLIEAEATITTLQSQKAKAIGDFVADNTNKLNEAANKTEVDTQTLAKARARAARTLLVSPVDGVVQKLAVTTVGQVVTTGQALMTIVPGNGSLQIEAFVANTDIGFVKLGQETVIKIDSFPFTRYGTIKGRVVGIATDAVDEAEARMMQANATSLANSANSTASSGNAGQAFVFPVIIAIDQRSFQIGDQGVPLSPGMSVTVEIKTDSQRIIDYLLTPLARVVSSALHER
ncbi:hemolysin D [Rhizobiales bacterium GAS191]|nr:hemolysin D [Rhizobiales bacterium GAS191]